MFTENEIDQGAARENETTEEEGGRQLLLFELKLTARPDLLFFNF